MCVKDDLSVSVKDDLSVCVKDDLPVCVWLKDSLSVLCVCER